MRVFSFGSRARRLGNARIRTYPVSVARGVQRQGVRVDVGGQIIRINPGPNSTVIVSIDGQRVETIDLQEVIMGT